MPNVVGEHLACSRRSDSGKRCEVKRSAFFTLRRSPLSERLEQASEHRDFLMCQSRSLQSYNINVSTVTHGDGNQW